jgi:hypothetical protein
VVVVIGLVNGLDGDILVHPVAIAIIIDYLM